MSTPFDSCFENIIGLSTTNCDCFTDEMPIDASTSNSGLYIDQLEGMNLKVIEAAADCENGLWEMMDVARRNAIVQFKADMLGELQKKYVVKRKPYLGIIGKTAYRKTLSISQTYAGASIFCAPQFGGKMRIKRIGTCFANAGNFTLTVYNSQQDAAIHSYTLNTTVGGVNWNTISALDLPMTDEGGQSIQYYFTYQIADSGQPKDNGFICCGDTNNWNYDKPHFPAQAKNRWASFCMINGFSSNNISTNEDRDDVGYCGSGGYYSNGLLFDVEFLCDMSGLICSTITDFEDNPTALVVAGAIRYLSGMFLTDAILATNNPGYYTLSDRDRLKEKKNTYSKEYLYRVTEVLPQAINIDYNDCFTCDNSHAPRKVGIRS